MREYKQSRYTEAIQYKCLEDLTESSLELSLIHCGKEQCEPLHVVQAKRDEIILHFIFFGEGTYSTGDEVWHLKAGQMFLMYPDVVNTYIADSQNPWFYGWIAITGTQAESILQRCGLSASNPIGSFDDTEVVLEYINKILEYRHLSYANDLKRRGLLLELFGYLNECHAKNNGTTNRYDYSANVYVNHAVEYISLYYGENINVTSIAEYIGITRAHLNNCFQKELGVTVQTFLIDYRLHQAAQLLSTTTDSINEIAASVGYPDPLAFSKAFKKRFGKSPKFFRANNNDLLLFDEKL